MEALPSVVQPVDLPQLTFDLPGIGGVLRQRPEDFEVEEISAYPPDFTPDRHLFFQLEKRGLTSEEAVSIVAQHCGISTAEIGIAGLKDKHALTRQWLSAPAEVESQLATFSHSNVILSPRSAHSHKLRRGHLRGNRFAISIRDLAVPLDQAIARTTNKFHALQSHGLSNHFGPQRFGRDGSNGERGLAALLRGPKKRQHGRLPTFILSAGQSLLFNAYVLLRRENELWNKVLVGDVLKKTDTGGLFVCEDPKVDQERLLSKQVGITGPMFGSKMKSPLGNSPADLLEQQILQDFGISSEHFLQFGRKLTGTRRELIIRPQDCEVCEAPGIDSLTPGIRLSFVLPAGVFATNLLSEVMGPSTA